MVSVRMDVMLLFAYFFKQKLIYIESVDTVDFFKV